MAAATQAHIGKPVAILLDGRVIAALTLRTPISDSAVISGNFTRAEADAIAAGLAARSAAAAPRPQVYTTTDPGVVLPVVVNKVNPRYTQAAMDAKVQGIVELSGIVRADGTVGEVAVVQSLDATYGLDEVAANSLREWTFTPGTKDGAPVDVRVTFNINFTLK